MPRRGVRVNIDAESPYLDELEQTEILLESRPGKGTLDPGGVIEFLRKTGGETTRAIASRFGWTHREAHLVMCHFKVCGMVSGQPWTKDGGGTMYWESLV